VTQSELHENCKPSYKKKKQNIKQTICINIYRVATTRRATQRVYGYIYTHTQTHRHTHTHKHTHSHLHIVCCSYMTSPMPPPPLSLLFHHFLPFPSFPFGTHFVRCSRFVVVIKGVNAVDNYTHHPNFYQSPLGPRTLLLPLFPISPFTLSPPIIFDQDRTIALTINLWRMLGTFYAVK